LRVDAERSMADPGWCGSPSPAFAATGNSGRAPAPPHPAAEWSGAAPGHGTAPAVRRRGRTTRARPHSIWIQRATRTTGGDLVPGGGAWAVRRTARTASRRRRPRARRRLHQCLGLETLL